MVVATVPNDDLFRTEDAHLIAENLIAAVNGV